MRPVDRLMPARKAETITHCQSGTVAVLHDIAYVGPHQMHSESGGRASTLYQQRKSPRLAKSYHHDWLCSRVGRKGILIWLEDDEYVKLNAYVHSDGFGHTSAEGSKRS